MWWWGYLEEGVCTDGLQLLKGCTDHYHSTKRSFLMTPSSTVTPQERERGRGGQQVPGGTLQRPPGDPHTVF